MVFHIFYSNSLYSIFQTLFCTFSRHNEHINQGCNDSRYNQSITIVAGMIVNCYFTLSPIVETAIDFSDSCLCGLKLISFRRKNGCLHHGIFKQTKNNDVLNNSDLCFVNYEYVQEQFVKVRKSNIFIICLFII